MNKYNAQKTTIQGITFDSKKEASRYLVLLSREQAGEITDLQCQPRWPLVVNGVKVSRYTADFSYTTKDGEYIVEDVKSTATKTRAYVMRRKLMLALHGIEIREV